MNQEEHGYTESAPTHCTTAKVQLAKVNAELSRFQAKDLVSLQHELSDFVGQQDALVSAYKDQYPALRKTWCDRQLDVERLYAHMRCEFPLDKDKWQKIIADCICTPAHDIHCLKRRVARRRRCAGGKLEREFLAADARYVAAQAELTALTKLVEQVKAALDANLALVGGIEQLGPKGRAVAIYRFYWKLLPAHKALAPQDISPDCLKIGSEGDAHLLCKIVWDKGCKDEEGACTPPEEVRHPHHHHGRPVPWLMPPADYSNALDCAWDRYQQTRDERAEAKSKYDADQDSLEALSTRLTTMETGLDAAVEACLAAVGTDSCCDEKPSSTRTN
jgi:hypothetical protein